MNDNNLQENHYKVVNLGTTVYTFYKSNKRIYITKCWLNKLSLCNFPRY